MNTRIAEDPGEKGEAMMGRAVLVCGQPVPTHIDLPAIRTEKVCNDPYVYVARVWFGRDCARYIHDFGGTRSEAIAAAKRKARQEGMLEG